MRDEYDFSNGEKNPYVKRTKTAITIRLDSGTIEYFKNLAEELNMPYQTLINSYLVDCASKKKKPEVVWSVG
ncbi:MAG: BrnA antitoxin family protein [Candidatus Adiutrix sp.]|jgi:predicted DNA binding CopG/RHH family protein|nr:BrnA antitoxin family protein [Candidatus Adiutrix sp.]